MGNGGIIKSSTVLTTDYLIYDTEYGTNTTKYKRAMELNGRGKNIQLIPNIDFIAQIRQEKSGRDDADGKVVYEPKAAEPVVKVPFLVRVSVPDLNIRTGPGVDHPRTGKFTGVGTFTIVEVREGRGSSEGWGRLKSGAGWIALSLVKRV